MAFVFEAEKLLGGARWVNGVSELEGGRVMEGGAVGDGLSYVFEKGMLKRFKWLTLEMLLEGKELCVFSLALREGEEGAEAEMHWGMLNWCEGRVRVPLEFVNQNRWMYPREGAVLKPCAGGQRVDLEKVDRMTLRIMRMGTAVPVRWQMTDLRGVAEVPEKLVKPRLPKGALVDELGQSTLHDWAGKTRDEGELVLRLKGQLAGAEGMKWPGNFSRWGGWREGMKLEGSGFFRTHFDGKRWWMVDPEGYLFWSAGMDCVGPRAESNVGGLGGAVKWLPELNGDFAGAMQERVGANGGLHVSYLTTNLIRAFGKVGWRGAWEKVVLGQLREFGMNTVGNWSEWKMAKEAGFPYVRPLSERFPTTPCVFRDFPDVWHANFARDCAAYAEQLRETLGDPAMIGYFLMNEPTWGFAQECPALGMLYNLEHGEARTALAGAMQQKYGSAERLSEAWGVATRFEEVERGIWRKDVNATMKADLEGFSTLMVDRLFRGVTDACKKVDPHHMNLGARYYTVPPDWCLMGMTCFDVFSLNAYAKKIPAEKYDMIARKLGRPVLAGEWHFGALDAGLPASGIGHVPTQAERGKAYRVYLEDAAACGSCVGVHFFQMYDQSVLGRFDGENYNIGFVDVCGRAYGELAQAARASHERMYAVASGQVRAYGEEVTYLPLLFI